MRHGARNRPAIIVKDLLAANAAYAERMPKPRRSSRPRRRAIVLTCMDARMDPLALLGLRVGDVHIIRNAGGRATKDAIRSIAISQWLLGTKDVLVIHHSGCGLIGTAAAIRSKIEREAKVKLGRVDLQAIADLESSVRDDVRTLRRSPILRRNAGIAGFIYDVRSGKLRQVEPRK